MKNFISTAILFLALIFSNTLLAKVYYVNGSYTGTTENGNSWTTPYKKLEDAIALSTDGDEIWVAKGTYIPTTDAGYSINKSITIYGGFAGGETSIYARNLELNKTVLKSSQEVTYNTSIFKMEPNKEFVVDGLDITDFGFAFTYKNSNINDTDRYILTINNCNIYGVGLSFISLYGFTDLTISNSSISLSNGLSVGKSISNNTSIFSNITFENTKFYNLNNSTGGFLNANDANIKMINCDFNNFEGTVFSWYASQLMLFRGCNFNNCTKSLFSLYTSNSSVALMEDCIIGNFNSKSTPFYFNNQAFKLSNCTIKDGVLDQAQLFYAYANLEFDNVHMLNIRGEYPIISMGGSKSLKIKNSSFEEIKGSGSIANLVYSSGQIDIHSSTFKNNSTRLIIQGSTANSSFSNCVFENNHYDISGIYSEMIVLTGDTKIDSCEFLNNTYTSNSGGTQSGLITVNSGGRAANFVLSNSDFKNNTSSNKGGVIYNGSSELEVSNCLFENNSSVFPSPNSESAGAIYSTAYGTNKRSKISDTKFINNSGNNWGAVYCTSSGIDIINCVFERNKTRISALNTSNVCGALFIESDNKLGLSYIKNTNFINNESISGVGALWIYNSNFIIDGSIFKNNVSQLSSSAIYNFSSVLKIYNSLFDGNKTNASNLGAIYLLTPTSYTDIYNSTFVNNKALVGADVLVGGSFKTISNSIFWNNGIHAPIGILKNYGNYITVVSNCNIQGGFAGTKIYDTNPKFVNFAAEDYRLSCQSPLINKGNNALGVSMFDLDGASRIFADTIDIGAYETKIDPEVVSLEPLPAFTLPTNTCKDEVIQLQNTTLNANNYTFFWDFGTGYTSTLFAPTYSYTEAGQYTVKLTASNLCGLTNVTTKGIIVKANNIPDIKTASIVCAGAEEIYSTNAICQSIVWTVTGGIIQSGQGTTSIKVLWGNGALGNGKITLLATGCGTDVCEIPVSVEIPIVPSNFTLTGPDNICQGAFAHYGTVNKDKSPATLYRWVIKGGTITSNTTNDYNLTDIDVQWNNNATVGVVYLTTYNELLKCGKTDSFKVNLRPKYILSGTTEVCTNNSLVYQVIPSTVGTINWQVTGQTNTISSGSVAWGSTPGTYKITAIPQDLTLACNAKDTLLVHVNAKPVVTGISGESEISLNSTDTYTGLVNTDINDVDFQWSSPGATILSRYSNNTTLLRNSFSPDNITLSVSTKTGSCASDPVSIYVKKLFDYTITGPDSVCIGTSANFVANENTSQSATYNWTNIQDGTTYSDRSIDPTFNNPGNQLIQLKVASNGKEFIVRKYVYVKSSNSNISIVGDAVIDPAGLQTAVYTIKNPANANYDVKIIGGVKQSLIGDKLTVKWGGTEPFSIQVQDIFNLPACKGVPVELRVTKAEQLSSGIIVGGPACLNSQIDYGFTGDAHTKNVTWNLNGGGILTSSSSKAVTVEWNQTGTHSLTLTYERFGIQTIQLPIVVNALPIPVIRTGTICGTNTFNLSTTQSFTAYSWYLKDANTPFSTLANPAIINEDIYTVRVIDNNGCSNASSMFIKQLPIPKARIFTTDKTILCSDANGGVSGITLSTFEGQKYTYQWYENDNQISGATSYILQVLKPLNQEKSYVYKVKVSLESCVQYSDVRNVVIQSCAGGNVVGPGGGGTGSGGIGVCTDPLISFTVDQNAVCPPFKFIVDPSITNPTGLGWDFGDGTTASGLNPTKTYTDIDAGAYTVQLTKGCRYYTTPVKVLARALFKLDKPGCVGTEITFNELSINYPGYPITKWKWNFGDGSADQEFTGNGDRDGKHTYTNAGSYTITLTVEAGSAQGNVCSFTTQKTYKINALPTANYTVIPPSCSNNTYALIQNSNFGEIGQGPIKWTFGNGQTSVNDTTLQKFSVGNQTIKLLVQDRLGCTNTKTSTIAVVAYTPIGNIITPLKDTILCNGKPVILTSPLAASGAYAWRKVGNTTILATTQTYNVTSAGQYTVTYATTSCTGTTAAVKVNSFAVPNLISGEKLNCEGNNLTIKSNISQPGFLYTWKHNSNLLPNNTADLLVTNMSAASAGNYQLTVTQAATGCAITLPAYPITVNTRPVKPDILASAAIICYNTSAVLHTTNNTLGKTFSWYRNGAQVVGVDTVITTEVLKNDADYFLNVKDNTTGCSTASDILAIKVAPAIPLVIAGDTTLCEQISSELTSSLAAKDFTFQWFKKDAPTGGDFSKLNFINIAIADSGAYTLKVTSKGTTNLLGCTAVSNIKTIRVNPTALTPIITGVSEFCSGNTSTLTSNLVSNFVWNTGATTPSITVQLGGTYSVTSTNTTTGCKITATKSVIQNPLPDLSFVPAGEYERCGTNKIAFEGLNNTNFTSQKWFIKGIFFSDKKVIYPTQSGKYTLQVTTNKGCTTVSDTMLINAQECACYVTNTNDSGDGSLREAINCSNDKPGKDAIKFAIVGTGPFVIKPLTALPLISDEVLIDGFTQSSAGLYDVIIDGTGKNISTALALKANLSNVKISGLTIRNFTNGIDLASNTFNNTVENNILTNNTATGVLINVGANNNTIRTNQFIGGGSGIQFASTSKSNTIESNTIKNAKLGIEFKGGTQNTLRANTISGSSNFAILMVNATNNRIVSNTLGTSQNSGIQLSVGANTNRIDSNYIGVSSAGLVIANQENGISISPNVVNTIISNNTVSGNVLTGLYVEGKNTQILNNYIGTNLAGAILPNGGNGIFATADSIKIVGNSIENQTKYGVSIANTSSIVTNKIANNKLGGIYVLGTRNTVSQNTITNTNSMLKAIDLHAALLPAGNNNKQPAVFKTYSRSSSDGLLIKGTAVAKDTVEIFYNNNVAQQALLFAGAGVADAAGNWQIEIPKGAAFNPADKNFYVNTARSTANNTSELSTPFLTGCFTCICMVTNANDSGLGSLRAVIDSANVGACLTINFDIATDTIQLLSALSPIKVPLKIEAPYATDSEIYIKGNNTFNGLVVNNDGVQITGLGFTTFKTALVLNADYTTVRHATILNTKQAIAITGNNSSILSSAINTTWANDGSTYKADDLIVITGKGNTIGGVGEANKITNGKTGVLVNGGIANSILNNAIYNNTVAIAHVNNGNANQPQPSTTVGGLVGNTGTITGVAKPFDKIQLFSSTYVAEQATGFVTEVTADAAGNWTAIIPANKLDIFDNNYFVATATSTTGNTSKLSPPIRVGNFVQVCYVTNTNDAGTGSLREAVNCANSAGLSTNGIAARIEFQLPSTLNEINLLSGLTITNNFGVSVNARKTPLLIKTAATAVNCFTWATDNFTVKNITFQNFANALYCTGNNAIIDSNNFVSNNNAVYNNAANVNNQLTLSNNYFAGGISSVTSNKGSVAISKNTFGTTKDGVAIEIKGFGIAATNAGLVQITSNTFASIVKGTSAIVPATANGYAVSITNSVAVITSNTITGSVASQQAAIRLVSANQSVVTSNTISNSFEGVWIDNTIGTVVSSNKLTAIANRGINVSNSSGIKLTQNTITGLDENKNPIDLNLASTTPSNSSKAAPVILTSTYHDGQLFLIGQSEKEDEIELFYSNAGKRDLVSYIETTTADTTGTWIISFPITAAGSDALFFRAVATKAGNLSSQASNAFSPDLKICLVTTTADAGDASLRDAIDKANTNVCNLIQFAIPGTGVAQIATVSELPDITAPLLIIDGTSQSGYNTGSPRVNLIYNGINGFNGKSGNQLDIYGMKISNFKTAITILNSKVVNVNDNSIEDVLDTGIKITTTGFIYGTIQNNTIKAKDSIGTAISLQGTTKMQITNNRISDFSIAGISIQGNNQKVLYNTLRASNNKTAVGIALLNSSNIFIEADTIVHAAIGMQIVNGTKNTVLSNVIGKTDSTSKARGYVVAKDGVTLTGSNSVFVSLNTINVNKNAIRVTNSKGYLIDFNTTIKSETGILLTNAPNGNVNSNTIDSSKVGIQVDASHGVTLHSNLIMRSLNYGIALNVNSDTCNLTANIIGARYFGDTTYAVGAGILVKSSHNYIGPDALFGFGNYIKQNKKGGVIVDGGKQNSIKYNFFYNNDISKGKPTAFAIQLKNSGNNTKLKPTITAHKWVTGKLHIYGTNNGLVGDSIHVYLGTGGYEEVSLFLGKNTSAALGKWEVIVDTSVSNYIPSNITWYLVATATDLNRNTSPFSEMYIFGDCYITSLKDSTDDQYPLPNTMRMAMKCANGQSTPVGIFFNVDQGGEKEVKLKKKMLDLNNRYGVQFNGKNIPDGVIASMNGMKLNNPVGSPAWTIAATTAKSTIANFQITNARNGLEVLADSILIQKIRFDKITQGGVLVKNKHIVVDSCVFDSLAVGIHPAANAVATILSGNTFNGTSTGIFALAIDSLHIRTSTFNSGVLTGIDIRNATHATIASNTFKSDTTFEKAIVWDNSKGLIDGNTFTAHFVTNPVSIANSANIDIRNNIFKDTADVYLMLSNVTRARIENNSFNVAKLNSIKTINTEHTTIQNNYVYHARNDAFNLEKSKTIFVSKNTVNAVRYTSKTDSALCINIHKGEGTIQSNIGKQEPTNLKDSVKVGIDQRTGIVVSGFAEAGDSIELFLSDSISASMNRYLVSTITKADKTWEVKIPREFYYKDTVTWYHVIAVAIDADSNTSKTSAVLHIPPATTKVYVLNTYNTGDNSLRYALRDVNNSDLYAKVIFSIYLPVAKNGPYDIKIDSMFASVYSYKGFEMDGNTQRKNVPLGDGQRILVNGMLINSNFGLDITDSSDACSLKNMWFSNTKRGLRISNHKNKIEEFHFINTDSSGVAQLDTAFVIQGNENAIKNIGIENYKLGVLFQNKAGENTFTESTIDSANIGMALKDSSFLNYISKVTFTNTTKHGILIDSAAADNKIDKNNFGTESKPVKGNAITIKNSSNQTITSNRMSYVDENPALAQISSAIQIAGKSSNNFIYNNRIGLDELGKNVHVANVRGITIEQAAEGAPSENSIVGNEINGTKRAAIHISNSSQDLISENIIGGDSTQRIFGIDTTAIFVTNSINEQINDNIILGYANYGIELLTSSGIQMHRNTIYSKTNSNKAINIHADEDAIASNGKIVTPVITTGILTNINTIKLTGTALAGAVVEVYQSVKDTVQAINYVNNAFASADISGNWELMVPKAFFSYATQNTFTAQNHLSNNSSELGATFTPAPVLCQLENTPSIKVIEPKYTPCPGPEFNIEPTDLDDELSFAWKAPMWTDSIRTKKLNVVDTTENLVLKVSDQFGCTLVRTTDVIFKKRPTNPNFIISSNVFAGDTIVLVDISSPTPETYTWYSSPGVTVLHSSDKDATDMKGEDGNTYPKGVRAIQFVLPDSGVYTIRQTSIREGCFVDQTKEIHAREKDVNVPSPYFVAPEVQNMYTYPNPVALDQDVFVNIKVASKDVLTLKLYNLLGNEIGSTELSGKTSYNLKLLGSGTTQLFSNDLAAGVYILKLTTSTGDVIVFKTILGL